MSYYDDYPMPIPVILEKMNYQVVKVPVRDCEKEIRAERNIRKAYKKFEALDSIVKVRGEAIDLLFEGFQRGHKLEELNKKVTDYLQQDGKLTEEDLKRLQQKAMDALGFSEKARTIIAEKNSADYLAQLKTLPNEADLFTILENAGKIADEEMRQSYLRNISAMDIDEASKASLREKCQTEWFSES